MGVEVCLCVYICPRVYVCVFVRVCVFVYVRMRVGVCVFVYVLVRACVLILYIIYKFCPIGNIMYYLCVMLYSSDISGRFT